MKSKIRWSLLFMCICIGFSLAGCTDNPSERETLNVDTSVQKSDVPANHTEGEDETVHEEHSDTSESMRAVITINGAEYGMTITDTTIGRAFAKKLQDEGTYTVTGYRSTDDLCCSESESLETDPTENMPWVCGGVAWTGSWFTIWVSEEAANRDMPIVAQIDEEYLEELLALSGNMEIVVRLTAETEGVTSEPTVQKPETSSEPAAELPEHTKEEESMKEVQFYITANSTTFTANFAENNSADAFRELLSEENLTINMRDYGSFEKVGSIGTSLPRKDTLVSTTTGDVMLYQGSQIVIFYGTNQWSYSRLGKVDGATAEALLSAFGSGDVAITFSLTKPQ